MKETFSVESLIYHFISERGLHEGSPLPSDEELATMLRCSVEGVAKAMDAAARKGKIKRQQGGPTVVLSPPVLRDQDEFSFSRSARLHGEAFTTRISEQAVRTPLDDEADLLTAHLERRAHAALGLKDQEPFVVIVRIRLLQDCPRVIDRAYLDPKRFPSTLLNDHDFEKESLIHVYNRYGYTLKSRDTTLTARLPTPGERNEFHIGLTEPVLDVEQQLFAQDPDTEVPFMLEYMQAIYLHWRYRIEARPLPLPHTAAGPN
jgi:DNA-binding GntR family transcriptional regulator